MADRITEAQAKKQVIGAQQEFDFNNPEDLARSKEAQQDQIQTMEQEFFDLFGREVGTDPDQEIVGDVERTDAELDQIIIDSIDNTDSFERIKNYFRIADSVISADRDGNDLFNSYMASLNRANTKQAATESAISRVQRESEEFRSVFSNLVLNTPNFTGDDIEDLAKATDLILKETAEKVVDPDIIYDQFVESLTTATTPGEQAKIQKTIQSFSAELQQHSLEMGWGEKAWSIVNAFLGPKHLIEDTILTGTPLTAADTLKEFSLWFRSQPVEKQEEYWPIVKKFFFDTKEKGEAIDLLRQVLDPSSEFTFQKAPFEILNAVELGGALKGLFNLSKFLFSESRLTQASNRLDNIDISAEMDAMNIVDDTASTSRVLSTERVDSATRASSFNITDLDPDTVKGMSPRILEKVLQFRHGLSEDVEGIIKGQESVIPKFMTESERVLQESKLVDDLIAAEEATGKSILSTSITKRTKDGIEVEILYDNPSPVPGTDLSLPGQVTSSNVVAGFGDPVRTTKKLNFNFDETAGAFKQDTLPFGASVGSPRFWAKDQKLLEDIETAIRLNGISPKIAETLDLFERLAIKGLKRKEKKQLNEVLLKGDEWLDGDVEVGKVFTVKELKQGIPGQIEPMSDKQIEAYFKLRAMYDNLGILNNAKARQELTLRGFKELTILGRTAIGKVFGDKKSATAFVSGNLNKNAYISDLGKTIRIDQLVLDEMYAKGYTLVKTHKPFNPTKTKDNRYTLVFTKTAEIRDLPPIVLNFKKGYVPRSYERGAYWGYSIRFNEETGLNQRNAVVHFDNVHEAEAWRIREQKRADELKTGERFEQFPSGEIDQIDIWDQGLGFGQLYTSARSQKPIPRMKDGKLLDGVERKPALEALSDQINTLSLHYPRNEWRLALEARIRNTADRLGIKFEDMNTPVDTSRREGQFIEKLRLQYRDWMHFRTKGEMRWEQKMQDLYNWALDPDRLPGTDQVLGRGAWWLKSTNPTSAIRASTFHLLLGWFNPIQMWTQAQGLAVSASVNAFSLRPDKVFRIAGRQEALREMQNVMHNKEAFDLLATKFAKVTDYTADEWKLIVNAYERLGFKQGVLSTADYSAVEHGWAISHKAFKQTLEKGQFMYRAGENLNRRYAFMTALDEIGDISKLSSDEVVNALGTRTNNLLLNLSRANRNLNWQTGLVSIPTQFWQIQAKFIEAIIFGKGGLDVRPWERARIALGQLALYGTAGVPLSTLGSLYLKETLGITDEQIAQNPAAVKAWNQGFQGWVALQVLGADIDVANRGAMLNNIERLMADLMFGSDREWRELAMGAFGTVFEDSIEASSEIFKIARASLGARKFPTFSDYLRAAHKTASITSTWKSGARAWLMMSQNEIMNRRGVKIVEGVDFNWQTELAVALGFQPSIINRTISAEMLNRWRKDYEASVKDSVRNLLNEYTFIVNNITGEYSKEDEESVLTQIDYLTGSLTDDAYQRLMSSLKEDMLDDKSKQDKAYLEFFKRRSEGTAMSLREMAARLIITQDDIVDFSQDLGNK